MKELILTLGLALVASTTALNFEIVKHEPASTFLKEGDTLTLLCTASSYWEWCTFKHSDKICDYAWIKDNWNVSVLACDDFADRTIEFHGDYDYYQRGIKLTGVLPEDAGDWTCEMESYHNGYERKYGYVREKTMTVEVEANTTTITTEMEIEALKLKDKELEDQIQKQSAIIKDLMIQAELFVIPGGEYKTFGEKQYFFDGKIRTQSEAKVEIAYQLKKILCF